MESKKEPKIIDMGAHNNWGDNIYFYDWETRQISGHMTPMPEKGDFLINKMVSGKTALFKVIEIKPCLDPKDQFFGTVKPLGYVEDIQAALIEFGKTLQEAFKPILEAFGNLVNSEEFQIFLIEYHKEKEPEEARKE